jgi:hypothetical protein
VLSRRQFVVTAGATVVAIPTLQGCNSQSSIDRYTSVTQATWQLSDAMPADETALHRELIRCATLAPSSHNTQCWHFHSDPVAHAITITPDFTRRCPAVDPDDHHLFVSLGCAAENLVQAARAFGRETEVQFDPATQALRLTLMPGVAASSSLYLAIPHRQHTRGLFGGPAVTVGELAELERVGSGEGVRVMMINDRPAMERVLEQVAVGNSAQLHDEAFVQELKHWIRFNRDDAVRTGDGLFSGISGNPSVPSWLGSFLFDLTMRPEKDNDRYAAQVRSSAGIAVFVSEVADAAHWVEVGRCYERFALQCTAYGIRVAMLNQPLEVATMRGPFAASIGIGGSRPDLIVRFGRGAAMPQSLRRDVAAVLV